MPIFPLILLLLFNDLVISSIKVNVVSAMIMGLFLTMIFECIRNRKNISNIFKSMQVFFDGMGKQFATIVTLIMAGEIFAEGLKHMGVIDMIIEGCKSIGFGAIPMTIIMVAIIIISSIVMGSGAAPFYAFIALAPSVAEAFGIQPVVMIMAMQLATGLGRNMSPIASCVVAACGGSGVSPVDVAKRTIIPMLLGTAALILADVIFFI
ncbi:C4-dicarboxylate transporter DcuC [Clostridium cadaveris]|uniref:C4-dicarboxylate transporter DcuC n=1 Tax=Clostridium cadaveris TaxID=1529 RepID=UPI001E427F2E|nr:C4-dicarboxylate transporter DcuC [Clostridium cadaveris]UFH63730.1 C4-dicarboxylate transporter DcuC [Clostridium cadaveris]